MPSAARSSARGEGPGGDVPRVLAVSVGTPERVVWKGRELLTSIFKRPVEGPVSVGPEGLEGDVQADRAAHGGTWKAVYAYPVEHYDWWRAALVDRGASEVERLLGTPSEPVWGAFGENLTVSGLDEGRLGPGDVLRIGSARLVVTEPRFPCVKLAARFGEAAMVARFLASGRSGFYLRVLKPGRLRAGETISVQERDGHGVTVADFVSWYRGQPVPEDVLERMRGHSGIRPKWRVRMERAVEERAPGGEG